ncbi:MAG: Ig domain-containing protein [Candidatus Micrarchaeota archaeon]|nr:Ig domain-containing protein [Candidatus Micrarchaeota archaeon]
MSLNLRAKKGQGAVESNCDSTDLSTHRQMVHSNCCSSRTAHPLLLLGQGAVEYLLVLAAVLVIALAAITYIGSASSESARTNKMESQIYWSDVASPLKIQDAGAAYGTICQQPEKGGYQFLLRNSKPFDIYLSSISIDGMQHDFCVAGSASASLRIPALSQRFVAVITKSGEPPCKEGDLVYLNLGFGFNKSGVSDLSQQGSKPLVLVCANSAPINESHLAFSSNTTSQTQPQNISGQPLSIVTTLVPIAIVDTPYSEAISAEGGVPPYTWQFSGNLLPGLSFNPSGVISGTPTYTAPETPPGPPGPPLPPPPGGIAPESSVYQSTFLANVTDANGSTVEAEFTLYLLGSVPNQITTTSLPDAIYGQSYYSSRLAITGYSGLNIDTWSIVSGQLPSGLSLDAYDGYIFGVPGAPDCSPAPCSSVAAFTVQNNYVGHLEQKALNITWIKYVNHTTLAINRDGLPYAIVGTPYSAALSAQYGTPPYTWEIIDGVPNLYMGIDALPSGLSLAPSGAISGTPLPFSSNGNNPDTRFFFVKVSDANGLTDEAEFMLWLYPIAPDQITTTSLPDAVRGQYYQTRLSVGFHTNSYSIVSGQLPSGLSLDGIGEISGYPGSPGCSPTPCSVLSAFTVQTTDSWNVDQKALNITWTEYVPLTSLAINRASLPDATVGTPYSAMLTTSNGASPFTWQLIGDLPPGLSLAPSGGISGTPLSPDGYYDFFVTVTDANGLTDEADFYIYSFSSDFPPPPPPPPHP